jgi:hypothetical protein
MSPENTSTSVEPPESTMRVIPVFAPVASDWRTARASTPQMTVSPETTSSNAISE